MVVKSSSAKKFNKHYLKVYVHISTMRWIKISNIKVLPFEINYFKSVSLFSHFFAQYFIYIKLSFILGFILAQKCLCYVYPIKNCALQHEIIVRSSYYVTLKCCAFTLEAISPLQKTKQAYSENLILWVSTEYEYYMFTVEYIYKYYTKCDWFIFLVNVLW